MEKWFKKVALVTGASSGIGKEISIKLVAHGLKVIGCGRNFERLKDVKIEIPKTSLGEFIPFKCDVSCEKDVLSLFEFILKDYKGLHICINNAGLAKEAPLLHGKTEDWKETLDVNVLGLSMCTREAYKLMKENEIGLIKDEVPGHIINVCSLAGHRVVPNSVFHFYSASKYAVTAITEGTRQELREAKSNIRVTQISPGFVETEFQFRAGGQELLDKTIGMIKEPLQPSDISDAIIFALSAPPRSSVHDIIIRPTVQAS